LPSLGRSRRWGALGGVVLALGGVVLIELALVVAGHHLKGAQVSVGHVDVSLEVAMGSATATATGRLSERSSSETRRNPRTCSALGTG